MTYKAKVTLKYESTWEHKIGSTFGEDILPEENVTYEFPVTTVVIKEFEKPAGALLDCWVVATSPVHPEDLFT